MANYCYLHSFYKNPSYKRNDNGKLIEDESDYMFYVYKDNDTGKSYFEVEESPKVPVYFSKSKREYPEMFVKKDELEVVFVRYKDRLKAIAQKLGLLDEFYNSLKNNKKGEFYKKIINDPNIYMADVNIEDYNKFEFVKKHGLNVIGLKKAFLDIEVENIDYDGFPDEEKAPCPINVVSILNVDNKTIYTHCLVTNYNKNDVIWIKQNYESYIQTFIEKSIISEFKIEIKFYSDEKSLILAMWNTIHELKPNFVGVWNMRFDAVTILNRMKKLGLCIEDVVCHPDVPKKYRYVNYKKDERSSSFNGTEEGDDKTDSTHPSRKFDLFTAANYSQFYDQMALYSNRRKRYILPSYKLDDIGLAEVNYGKMNYNENFKSLKDLMKNDFKTFVAYNIQDVFVQYLIEKKVEDLDKYLFDCRTTPFFKGIKLSSTIKNFLMETFDKDGDIIGNNTIYPYDGEKPVGAIVARPELIKYKGVVILGEPSDVYENVIDLDASSEYPSLMMSFNIDKSTTYGRVVGLEYPDGSFSNIRGEINKLIETRDSSIFELCKRYMGLPNVGDFIKFIDKIINSYKK